MTLAQKDLPRTAPGQQGGKRLEKETRESLLTSKPWTGRRIVTVPPLLFSALSKMSHLIQVHTCEED